MRFASLIFIFGYGGLIVFWTQASSPSYGNLLGSLTNCVFFYFFIVVLHLWLGRGKDWKLIGFYTSIVLGSFIELLYRVSFPE